MPDGSRMGLRPMRRRDLPRVLSIEGATFRTPWSRDAFEREFHLPQSRQLVAHGGAMDEALGYAIYWRVLDEIYLLDLAVDPGSQRQGVATLLVEKICCDASADLVRVVSLEVAVGNSSARAFYAAVGFEETGRRPRYYARGEDALVLERRVR